MTVIVAVAALGNRVCGFVATVSATLWFDYFLTRPYEKLAITHRPDIETAVSLFVVGIIVTELAARSRHHHATAVEEADFVGLIHDVSELATSGAPSREVIERVRREMVSLLHLRECRYESGQAEHTMRRLEHDGHVLLGGRAWAVDSLGLPGPEIELLVQVQRARARPICPDANPWDSRVVRTARGRGGDRRSGRPLVATPAGLSSVGSCSLPGSNLSEASVLSNW